MLHLETPTPTTTPRRQPVVPSASSVPLPVPDLPSPYEGVERGKKPRRAVQTFFRTNFHNHINLSHIADNKAHIMISVNSILISIIISMAYRQNIAQTNPKLLLPIVLFLVCGVASLVFAVLSARPKVTRLNAAHALANAKQNIMFFGNFTALTVTQYEEAVEQVLQDKALLYGNMTRDLYHLGKVLDQKYKYLSIAYNVFMIGFIATVVTFLFAIL